VSAADLSSLRLARRLLHRELAASISRSNMASELPEKVREMQGEQRTPSRAGGSDALHSAFSMHGAVRPVRMLH
jgi:hypothetical protein